jgi:NADPH2:quinone reductase
MRAVEIVGKALQLTERRVPSVATSASQVLIKVAYAGVNRPDVVQRLGLYAPPPGASDLPGLEVSGTVAALVEGCAPPAAADGRPLSVGDEVCALLPGGGYAEYALAEASSVMRVPASLSLAEAAAVPETFSTAWFNLCMQGWSPKEGARVLVHGGSSGVGTAAVQVAGALGAEVLATAGSAAKCDAVRRLGAALAVNYREDDFAEAVRAFSESRGDKAKGVDFVLDMVGGEYLARNLGLLRQGGRLCCLGFLGRGGPAARDVSLMRVMLKQLTITGSTLRSQPQRVKAEIARQLHARVLGPMVERGRVRPVMDEAFALEDAPLAHARMEGSGHIGNIVLRVDDGSRGGGGGSGRAASGSGRRLVLAAEP